MSAITVPVEARPGSLEDPYYYGWRDVCTTDADGKTHDVRVPLTLEDCLHPEEGDVIVEGSLHDDILTYLSMALKGRYANDDSVLILSDTGVYWDEPGMRHHCPDIAVIFGIREPRIDWPSFYVAKQKTRPSLIVEVVSPNTRSNDVVTKVEQYHRVRIPIYVIVDRVEDQFSLRGFLWTPTHYLPMPADELGRLWLEPVGLWLALKDDGVVLIDGETGQELSDYISLSNQLHEEKARADAERVRAEGEKMRAVAEAARANSEAARAEAEAAARLTAEAKIRELEERLARLSEGPAKP